MARRVAERVAASRIPPARTSDGPAPDGTTFSDALTTVRRWLWREWVFPQAGGAVALEELPQPLQDVVFYALAPAA
jgi:hypothetical protein